MTRLRTLGTGFFRHLRQKGIHHEDVTKVETWDEGRVGGVTHTHGYHGGRVAYTRSE